MTPKEKAEELYNKVYGQTPTRWTELEIEEDKRFAKQCALIAVDEIIKQFVGVYDSLKDAGVLDSTNVEDSANYKYWQEVKQEIKKL